MELLCSGSSAPGRRVLTHLSEDMLGQLGDAGFEVADDGLALDLKPTGPERRPR